VLAPAHRLTRHREFVAVMRSGARAGRTRVVVHTLRNPPLALDKIGAPSTRVGLIVSKSVGGSVVRHSVSRKLRHVMRGFVPVLPDGTQVVLRALPPAATSSSAELEVDIRSALRKLGFPASSRAA